MALLPPAFRVEDLEVAVEARVLFRRASFDVGGGEHVALIGQNAVGKTSLVEALFGLRAKAGSVSLFGRPVTTSRADAITRRGAALIPESPNVFTTLTVAENLQLAIGLASRSRAPLFTSWREALGVFPELQGRDHQVASSLSGGEKRMLAVLRAALLNPVFLALDEPFLGLAPLAVRRLIGVLEKFAQRGVATLSTHQPTMLPAMRLTRRLLLADGALQPLTEPPPSDA